MELNNHILNAALLPTPDMLVSDFPRRRKVCARGIPYL